MGDDPLDKNDPTGNNELSPMDWKNFVVDNGKLLVDDIVGVTALVKGDEGTFNEATQEMVEDRTAAALSTATFIAPPGANKVLKIAQKTKGLVVAAKRSRAFISKVWANNRAQRNGNAACETCNKPLRRGGKLSKGDKVSDDRGEAHHKDPLSKGGKDDADTNGKLLCPRCHKEEHRMLTCQKTHESQDGC